MITGDYHHTAIAVARHVGMVKPQGKVVVIDTISEPQLRSELSTIKSPHSVVSRVASPDFTPTASFTYRRHAPDQGNGLNQRQDQGNDLNQRQDQGNDLNQRQDQHPDEQQMFSAEFEQAAMAPPTLLHMPMQDTERKHQSWADQQTPSTLSGAATMKAKLMGQLQIPVTEPASQDQQPPAAVWAEAFAAKSELVHQLQVPVAEPEQQQQQVDQMTAPALSDAAGIKAKLSGQVQIPSAQSGTQDQYQAKQHDHLARGNVTGLSSQLFGPPQIPGKDGDRHGQVKSKPHTLRPLSGAARMTAKLAGQLQIPSEEAEGQGQLQTLLEETGGQDWHQIPAEAAEEQSLQQQDTQHVLYPSGSGARVINGDQHVVQFQVPCHEANSPSPPQDAQHILPALSGIARIKSRLLSWLPVPEEASAQEQHAHELHDTQSGPPALTGLAKMASVLMGQLHSHQSDAASQAQNSDLPRGVPLVTGLARVRSMLMGQLQMPKEDPPPSESPGLFSQRGRLAMPLSIFIPPAVPEPSWEGLRFLTAGHEDLEASQALTALAEGQMQCAVTGDAFEHLLQHHDLSVLETVMRNVVVFSRMQPHQKGQVMDLLGIRGMHELFNGRTRFIPVSIGLLSFIFGWNSWMQM